MSYRLTYDLGVMNRRLFLPKLSALCGSGLTALAFLGTGGSEAPAPLKSSPDNAAWDWWRNLKRIPLTASDDQLTALFIRAAAARRSLWVVYHGGSRSGESRKVSPLGVFGVEGYEGIYVAAFCHERNAERTFRVDRITAVV